MSQIRVAFFGTPDIARYCLESLIQDEHFLVVGAVTQPDRRSGRKMRLQPSPVKELAESCKIPCISPKNVNTDRVLEQLKAWRPEAAVVVAFGQILGSKILDTFPQKIVNVHASLLPRWRGAAPIQRAIMAGDEVTGVCLQILVAELDAGDVLGARKIEITDDMNAIDLHERMKPEAAELLEIEFMDYLRGNLTPTPQDESQVTYARKLKKQESHIQWQWSAREIFNHMRGMSLGPGVYCLRKGKKLKLHLAEPVDEQASSGAAGRILKVDSEAFYVACGQGALKVLEVQPESRAKMLASEYLKGYDLDPGEILE